jgi:putative addiction module antidote
MLDILFNKETPMRLEIKKIGNSTGLILPKDLVNRLRLEHGQEVTVTETADGFRVSRHDPEFERALESARKGMQRYCKTLEALAK